MSDRDGGLGTPEAVALDTKNPLPGGESGQSESQLSADASRHHFHKNRREGVH